jgi:hypothetical protein
VPVAAGPPEDPPELDRDDDDRWGLLRALSPPPLAPPPDTAPVPLLPKADPVAAVPVVATEFVCVGLGGRAEFVEDPVAPLPRLTTPFCVTVPRAALVCAAAGNATTIERSPA